MLQPLTVTDQEAEAWVGGAEKVGEGERHLDRRDEDPAVKVAARRSVGEGVLQEGLAEVGAAVTVALGGAGDEGGAVVMVAMGGAEDEGGAVVMVALGVAGGEGGAAARVASGGEEGEIVGVVVGGAEVVGEDEGEGECRPKVLSCAGR